METDPHPSSKARTAIVWLFNNFERILVASFLSLFSIVLILQVFMRFVLRMPLPWPEEFSRYLLIWTAFVGSSLAVKESRFINIDILPTMSRGWFTHALRWTMHIGFMAFCMVSTYFSIDFIHRVANSGQVSPAMGIPMWIVYSAAPIGLTLATLRTIETLITGADLKAGHFEDKS
ncbi:TRAP transporter small permease [uncultured Cohaesibacter sp.]|uniref:TRAP transporter small permease n=1 Tax=uncultured Cohaesibacter sp. TaxID=1002546 RepID=UPI002930E9BB|nr:TRAP transporter small permease [uncultured Cohaesibacter sp.]